MWEQTVSEHRWRDRVPSSPRLRVLVESDSRSLAMSDFTQFSQAGIDVAFCPGPGEVPAACPYLRNERCPLADGADAIFFDLGEGGRNVLRSHDNGTPVVIRSRGDLPLPRDAQVITPTTSVAGQVEALRRAALSGRRRRTTPEG